MATCNVSYVSIAYCLLSWHAEETMCVWRAAVTILNEQSLKQYILGNWMEN
jgi:hypothetical protein